MATLKNLQDYKYTARIWPVWEGGKKKHIFKKFSVKCSMKFVQRHMKDPG